MPSLERQSSFFAPFCREKCRADGQQPVHVFVKAAWNVLGVVSARRSWHGISSSPSFHLKTPERRSTSAKTIVRQHQKPLETGLFSPRGVLWNCRNRIEPPIEALQEIADEFVEARSLIAMHGKQITNADSKIQESISIQFRLRQTHIGIMSHPLCVSGFGAFSHEVLAPQAPPLAGILHLRQLVARLMFYHNQLLVSWIGL